MSGPVIVRPLEHADRTGWAELYAGYAAFYRVAQDDGMRERVWGWLHDSGQPLTGLVAADDAGTLQGLAHCRSFTRPLSASEGGFLDDLFVAPGARGRGIGRALIEAVAALGRERSWTVVRWITASDNHDAQALYDRLAKRTGWVTYDLPLS